MALTPDKWFELISASLMSGGKIYVLSVALLTWGGLFAYLLRLDRLAKSLDEEVRARTPEAEKIVSSSAPIS